MSIIESLLENVSFPQFVKVRQKFSDDRIPPEKISDAVRNVLSRTEIAEKVKPGQRICLTCGSRGIDNIASIIAAVAAFCKERGAEPFAIPAMGSHGGATAEGQLSVLHSLGISEESIGCPIFATMETVQIGTTEEGEAVHIDRFAAESDGSIVINRIKPHTSFRGTYESGLMKMMAIGLGKQRGAETCHAEGFPQMHKNVPMFGKVILKNAPVLFGVGILENAFDHTAQIHALTSEEIISKEPVLLQEAFRLMPSIGFEECDVLIVDEIGKNISGCGMDPNISGVFAIPGMTGGIKAQRRCILSLTEETHGNGYGMGAADAITKRLFDQLDLEQIYPNSITSTSLGFSKIPIIMPNDRAAIALCIRTCNKIDKTAPKIIRVRNTLALNEIEISQACIPDLKENMQIETEPYSLPFDEEGNLL
ncbi:MAG: DUF2088 domain-containing protein [Clostridia bacterium]|nr:DUF2088 domain-containing protein [Clostridia bacterium]